jgi:hypothetical protein
MEDPAPWRRFKDYLPGQIERGILEQGDEVSVKYEARDRGINAKSARKAFYALADEGKLQAPPPPRGCGKTFMVL